MTPTFYSFHVCGYAPAHGMAARSIPWYTARESENKGGNPVVLPEAYLEFIRLFNNKKFWHSHEALELAWRMNGSTFYKGLIIFASAFVHAQRENPVGVRKQMAKALRYLAAYVPSYMGLDVDAILRHGSFCLQLAADWEADPSLPRPAFPFCTLKLQAELLRGDEAELSR